MTTPTWSKGGIDLYLGDYAEILPTIDQSNISTLFTSPPYDRQRIYKGRRIDWNVLMSGLTDFTGNPTCQVFVNLGLIHKQGECVPYWEAWRESMRAKGWKFFSWYVWDKLDGQPGDYGGHLAPCFEFIFHFNREPRHPVKCIPCKCFGKAVQHGTSPLTKNQKRTPKSGMGQPIGEFKIPDSVIRVYRNMAGIHPQGIGSKHPAVFPLALPEFFIKAYRAEGSLLDPFLGSGTSMVASINAGIPGIGIEIEPEYFAMAVANCELALAKKETP